MQIEQRGTPPYVITSEGIPEIPEGHADLRRDFLQALQLIFDLTSRGRDTPTSPQEVKPARIIDANGVTVFSASNQKDMELLKQINDFNTLTLI